MIRSIVIKTMSLTAAVLLLLVMCSGPRYYESKTLTCDGKAIFTDVRYISYEDGQWRVQWKGEVEYYPPEPGSRCSITSRYVEEKR